MVKRLNKACKYFPCHKSLEDCTFCYCPLYPCLDKKKGELVYSAKYKKGIWSCEPCDWIHKRDVVEDIFNLIRENSSRRQALKSDKRGIVVLSHGSRLKKANSSLDRTVRAIKQKTGLNTIIPAYLQAFHPDLSESIKGLVTRGCRTLVIVPFFLFNGNHVTRDIPGLIKEEKKKYPKIKFIYTKNLSEDMRIADIVADIIGEALI
jgi:Zn-finger protein